MSARRKRVEARWVRGERADAAETLPRLSLQATWLAQHTCNSRKDSPKSGAKIQSHASITSGLVPPRRAWESRTRAPASDQGNSTAASEAGCAEERERSKATVVHRGVGQGNICAHVSIPRAGGLD